MDIFLHNTLTGKKEKFEPLKKGSVSMYHCGPTVYNFPHIGNLRAYVFADTVRRLFENSDYKVKQVINITDVGHLVSDSDTGDDKMEKAAKLQKKTAKELAIFYTNVFMENLRDLNIRTEGTKFPKATEYIAEQIDIVKTLEEKGLTYKTSDGIYFNTAKFPAYGKLGNIDIAGIREGERIGINDEKKNPTDFALWKFSPKNEKREQEWDSPWGIGFPGWHIECSAMSQSLLGDTFDIHTGGIDHIPVHHNNEIAQSEGATGRHFVNYWMHSAFINVASGRMAKSEGNFLTLTSIIEKDISPLAYRYFLLGARYSTPMNFSWEALEASATAYSRLKETASKFIGLKSNKKSTCLSEHIANDLDTAGAIALLWDTLKDIKISPEEKSGVVIEADELLGLGLTKNTPSAVVISIEAMKILKDRSDARLSNDWKKSDTLRDELKKLGVIVKDGPGGQEVDGIRI